MIPKNIKKQHVFKVLKDLDRSGVPRNRKSRKFLLVHNGKYYPPKYVISLANKYANGQKLDPELFSGGKESNDFLESFGFKILKKESGGVPARKSSEKPCRVAALKQSHDERCKKCKETMLSMLQETYGHAEANYKLPVGTNPELFKDKPFYSVLKRIYRQLQSHRGYTEFVKVKNLPRCDFYVPNPGFIVEFDESQHFTKPREISLREYPENLRLGFDREIWIQRCLALDKRDNDPPYRDEQRAWYDTLRDCCSWIIDIPVVRILPEEATWCELDSQSFRHVKWFKSFIENKLKVAQRFVTATAKGLRIGLVFPELDEHDLQHFVGTLRRHSDELDLVVFPEGFETIYAENWLAPESFKNNREVQRVVKRYRGLCEELNIGIVLGVMVYYDDTFISGEGHDQYCLFMRPKKETVYYHKHSSSKYKAFYDKNWSIQSNLRVLKVRNLNVGVSICHDMYMALIPKVLTKKGADVWINISYVNVKSHKWQSVLQTRAIENGVIAVCTLHRNWNAPNVQKEPYAFSKNGKIKLVELGSNAEIESIPWKKRTGRIFVFDTARYNTYQAERLTYGELSPKARKIRLDFDAKNQLTIKGPTTRSFVVRELSVTDFIYSPQKLWEISLEDSDKITLFVVLVKNNKQWRIVEPKVNAILKGRVIEFGTLFVFANKNQSETFLVAYRSSSYKDSRIFVPMHFPIDIDERYLKGLQSTYEISGNDPRSDGKSVYFRRVDELIGFLKN